MTASSSARTAQRGRAGDRGSSAAQMLECVWRVGRGSELALRLSLPIQDDIREFGELAFTPVSLSDGHPLIGPRETLVSSAKRRWHVESRRIGEGEYELVLAEIDSPSLGRVVTTLATVVRKDANTLENAAAGSATGSAPVLVLTSLPSAIELCGGTYVLRRALLSTPG